MDGNPLTRLRARGQSVWLDDVHRRMLRDGTLQRLIEVDGLTGLKSNPATLAAAIMNHPEYASVVAQLVPRVGSGAALYECVVLDDLGRAADLLQPVYARNEGADGFVSLEVSPHLADDAGATVAEGRRLWRRLERTNVMIKVPGTSAGLEALRSLIGEGVNVDATLLFSPARYRQVVDAYCCGLEDRVRSGAEIATVASVASFFVSRIDTLIDEVLDEHAGQGRGEARALRGRTAAAVAADAYGIFVRTLESERWRALARLGARTQRLLWASTSTKDPRYSDVKYVEELIAPDTVNSMPLGTLEAYRDHGKAGAGLAPQRGEVDRIMRELASLGIDLDAAAARLEAEGVRKLLEPFDQLQQWFDARRT
jgi:transaldolase